MVSLSKADSVSHSFTSIISSLAQVCVYSAAPPSPPAANLLTRSAAHCGHHYVQRPLLLLRFLLISNNINWLLACLLAIAL